MTDAKKRQLIRLITSNEFGDALQLEDKGEFTPDSNGWVDAEFNMLVKLWKRLFLRGGFDQAGDHLERYVSEDGTAKFLLDVSVPVLQLLTKPRDANGDPYFDIVNFPLWFLVDDVTANVPTELPNSVTYADDDEDQSNPLPVAWEDWTFRDMETIDAENLFGAVNVQDGKSFAYYLAIVEAASGVSLVSKAGYDAKVAAAA